MGVSRFNKALVAILSVTIILPLAMVMVPGLALPAMLRIDKAMLVPIGVTTGSLLLIIGGAHELGVMKRAQRRAAVKPHPHKARVPAHPAPHRHALPAATHKPAHVSPHHPVSPATHRPTMPAGSHRVDMPARQPQTWLEKRANTIERSKPYVEAVATLEGVRAGEKKPESKRPFYRKAFKMGKSIDELDRLEAGKPYIAMATLDMEKKKRRHRT